MREGGILWQATHPTFHLYALRFIPKQSMYRCHLTLHLNNVTAFLEGRGWDREGSHSQYGYLLALPALLPCVQVCDGSITCKQIFIKHN